MTLEIIKKFFLMIGLCVMQALVLNRIHLFDLAIPLCYLWLPLHLKQNTPRWQCLLWCFVTGLIIDAFSNTLGIATASLTLIGLLQPYILPLFINRDEDEDIIPSAMTIGWMSFFSYSLVLTLIYCLVFFTIEIFSFFDVILWIECIGASTCLTLFLLLAMERILYKK